MIIADYQALLIRCLLLESSDPDMTQPTAANDSSSSSAEQS